MTTVWAGLGPRARLGEIGKVQARSHCQQLGYGGHDFGRSQPVTAAS